MKIRTVLLPALSLAAALAAATPASAQQCTLTVTGVSFGDYDGSDVSSLYGEGSVRVRCPGSVSNLSVSISTGWSGTFNPRAMMNGTEALQYNLFLDAGRTTIWGDGHQGTGVVTLPRANQTVTLPIFGVVPAGQDVEAGTYSDNLVITINF
jgi:spore coat protein U-like protein